MTRQQDSVGLTTFDTEVRLDMPARSSPRHFNEMMQRLEAITPGGETDIAETLHKLANRFKRRCLIVLISDLYDEPDEVIRALHHFRHRRHEVILFHVLDKAEIDFPFRDVIAFHDLETNERIQVDPAYVRDEYLAAGRGVHRALSPRLRRGPDRLRADRHVGALRLHAVAIPRQAEPPMTFAAPLFLMAALAVAIPVVLHMINRQKAKEMPFPTLRFLKISVQKTRRRKRVHDMLLMILRAVVLLLIAVGLARPAVTSLGALWERAIRAVAIILDNSASMGTIDQDRVRFETAAAAAGKSSINSAMATRRPCFRPAAPCFPVPTSSTARKTRSAKSSRQCRVSYERADLGLQAATSPELLAKSEAPNKQIYVLTDMQRVSWERREGRRQGGRPGEGKAGQSRGRSEHAQIQLAQSQASLVGPNASNPRSPVPHPRHPRRLQSDAKAERGRRSGRPRAAAPVAGQPIKATVTLLNASTVPAAAAWNFSSTA